MPSFRKKSECCSKIINFNKIKKSLTHPITDSSLVLFGSLLNSFPQIFGFEIRYNLSCKKGCDRFSTSVILPLAYIMFRGVFPHCCSVWKKGLKRVFHSGPNPSKKAQNVQENKGDFDCASDCPKTELESAKTASSSFQRSF